MATATQTQTQTAFDRFEKDLPKHLGKLTQLKKLVGNSRSRDTVLKTAIAALVSIELLGAHYGMAHHSRQELKQATGYLKKARVAFGLLNVLDGTIEIIIKDFIDIVKTCHHMRKGKSVSSSHRAPASLPSDPKVKYDHTTKAEKTLHLLSGVSRLTGSLSYLTVFGVLKPISFVHENFKTKVSESAKEVADKAGFVVFVMHVAAFIGAVFELIRDSLYYNRMQGTDEFNVDLVNQFFSDLALRIETMFEKALELIPLCIQLFYDQADKLSDFLKFLLSLCAVVASVIGLARLWNDSAVSY